MKACKTCKALTEASKCPACNSTNFSPSFKGKIVITDPEKSEIAKKLSLTKKGDYAIKVV